MDFLKTLMVSAAGLKVQSGRMRVIAENLANADSAARTPNEDPYRRKIPTVTTAFDKELGAQIVKLGKVDADRSDFDSRYEPGHPAADANGMVRYPNVSSLIESVDMREAQRTYEANLNVVSATRSMLQRTIDILRG
ncbi:flagellar basal body rod protein FlgC [Chthonobacter rhizosphaerae]|uniref:flagellar basal body rod protein FlgC n=1 Tax=Chthonobacter rhizosphaerae TaxID=2735553 RepID=UPI0015EF3709|nr:flagellar basal body rod protein FlgC [Chthonobacter rhizosphaerae]